MTLLMSRLALGPVMNETLQTPAEVLGQPLRLASGVTIKNRFMKSAMSEILGTRTNGPSEGLVRLYRTWAEGGCGLLVTGNVMVDRRHIGEPGNVVVEDERDLDLLRRWAQAGTQGGAQLWMQLNHPGKQIPIFLSREPVAPSAIPLKEGIEQYFATPRALEPAEIEEIVVRFGRAAGIAKKAGFTGVQIHGAHGYLINQFLSPRHNQRTDGWGGDLECRMRFGLEVYRSIRREVGDAFPVAIKLNSADFQKGGFTEDESIEVARRLAAEGLDFIEVSGGTYESPVMSGDKVRDSTLAREAYFLTYATRLRHELDLPLALTGGFRTATGMRDALASGDIDVVGLARPMAVDPNLPQRILSGEDYVSPVRQLTCGIKHLDKASMLNVTWYEQQLARMAQGRRPNPRQGVWLSIARTLYTNGVGALQRRA